jgi:hypothetical protein
MPGPLKGRDRLHTNIFAGRNHACTITPDRGACSCAKGFIAQIMFSLWHTGVGRISDPGLAETAHPGLRYRGLTGLRADYDGL